MIPYQIDDGTRRSRIYYGLAVISVALASVISAISPYIPFKFAAPSAMFFFGLLTFSFDRWFWKMTWFHRMTEIPLIEGLWAGTLTRNADQNGLAQTSQVALIITQTWTKMSLVFEGQNSKSHAQMIGLFVENKNDVILKWVYFAKDNSGINPNNLYGEGTTELTLRSNETRTLRGIYYSSKLRKGAVDLSESNA